MAAAVAAAVAREAALSRRETEVLGLAARGKCTKEIAIELGLSGKTVEYFWSRIFRKVRCRSQVEVMSLLIERAARGDPGPRRRTADRAGRRTASRGNA